MLRLTPCRRLNPKSFYKRVSGNGVVDQRYRENQRYKNKAINRGDLTAEETGASFTEPSVYTNKTSPNTILRYDRKVHDMARGQSLNASMDPATMDDEQIMRIEREGGASTAGQRALQRRLDEEALGMQGEGRSNSKATYVKDGEAYSNRLHRIMTRETPVERRERILAGSDIEPTHEEFSKLMRRLAADDESADLADAIQERLVEESGLYPAMRLDAYMLGDESAFPPWVHRLAPAVRDRVKYGNIGITEDDEALRVRLAKMPIDARRREWERLRAAKGYAAGVAEQRLSPLDIRQARLVKRNYFRLQNVRAFRANALRRIALRKPEAAELIPSHHVDYSSRLATIAQFVQNGVDTKGQWPLAQDELNRAKVRNKQEEAERMFLKTAEEKKMLKNSKFVSGAIGEALDQMDERAHQYKRVSRREYAHRVNNIVLGVGDDKGRRTRFVVRDAKGRPHSTTNAMASVRHRSLNAAEPNAMRFGNPKQRSTDNWHNREASFKGGQYGVSPRNV